MIVADDCPDVEPNIMQGIKYFVNKISIPDSGYFVFWHSAHNNGIFFLRPTIMNVKIPVNNSPFSILPTTLLHLEGVVGPAPIARKVTANGMILW